MLYSLLSKIGVSIKDITQERAWIKKDIFSVEDVVVVSVTFLAVGLCTILKFFFTFFCLLKQVETKDFEHANQMFNELEKRYDNVHFFGHEDARQQEELAFEFYDKDGDGYITKAEIGKLSKSLTKEQIEKVFTRFDADGDGRISYAEFRKMMDK